MLLNLNACSVIDLFKPAQAANHEQRQNSMAGMVCNMDATDIWALPF